MKTILISGGNGKFARSLINANTRFRVLLFLVISSVSFIRFLFSSGIFAFVKSPKNLNIFRKNFFKFLLKDKVILSLDISIFKSPKLKRSYPKSIDSDLVAKAFVSVMDKENDQWINLRDRAVMLLLYGSGLRISEALSLKKKEAPKSDWLRVKGKGNKYRDVPLLPIICEGVKEYLDLCPYDVKEDEPPVSYTHLTLPTKA